VKLEYKEHTNINSMRGIDVVQEEAGVNHIAAKIIDNISARPGPHAAVCPV